MSNPTIANYKQFGRLAQNKDFIAWVKFVEDFQQRRAFNLMSGKETEVGNAERELADYRGGWKLWKKAKGLVDDSSKNIKLLEEENVKAKNAKDGKDKPRG